MSLQCSKQVETLQQPPKILGILPWYKVVICQYQLQQHSLVCTRSMPFFWQNPKTQTSSLVLREFYDADDKRS